MAQSHTASRTIAELREFAGFTAQEQFFIERSLDLAFRRDGSGGEPATDQPAGTEISGSQGAVGSDTSVQRAAYRELRACRADLAADQPLEALTGALGVLVRVSAQDLARGLLGSFAAYRFLYERLLGAAVRPYLPAGFCAAAALPQIEPARRRQLLGSLSEAVVITPGWSQREPLFVPKRIFDEPDLAGDAYPAGAQ